MAAGLAKFEDQYDDDANPYGDKNFKRTMARQGKLDLLSDADIAEVTNASSGNPGGYDVTTSYQEAPTPDEEGKI